MSTDRPRASPFDGVAANAQQTETYGIAADGTPLQWETLQPSGSGPWPFVLLIHGGGFKAGDTHLPFNACAQDVVNAGYFAASIEYRLAPPGQLFRDKLPMAVFRISLTISN